MSLAAKLPYDHPYAGGFSGIGSQPLPTDADALDYLSRMATADGTSVEVGVATAVDAFYRDAKELGVFSSIRASCLLAGARTLAGALVPLKNEGPELWDAPTPTITNAFGSNGTWDANTQTATSSTTTISNTFPRFKFPVGIVAGKDYRITATLVVTDADALTYYRLGGDGVVAPPSAVNGVITIDETRTASTGAAVFELDFDSTIGPSSVTIESLSIREVIAAPTNVADGFVEGDFSRTAGLTGDGTSYIDSGRANDDDPQNDNHNAVYLVAKESGPDGYEIGAGASTGRNMINASVSNVFTRCRDATEINTGLSSVGSGVIGTSRSDSSGYAVRALGSDYAATAPSDGVASENVFVFAGNNGGSPIAISSSRLAFYSIGTSLSLADLDTAVTNLINRLKFAILVGENPSGLDPDTIDYIVRGYEAGGSLE